MEVGGYLGAYRERSLFELAGGRLSLELLNTMGGLRGVRPRETLTEYADLAWWANQVGLVDRRRMQELIAEAEAHPRRAAQALQDALDAREALHELVLASIEAREPLPSQLELVNRWIAEAMRHRRLRPRPGRGFSAAFDDDGDLLAFLRPVAADAARVLEGDLQAGIVHRCEESSAGRCGWMFVDETRNHSRRFCSMKDCGNRAKQRRFQQRKRE